MSAHRMPLRVFAPVTIVVGAMVAASLSVATASAAPRTPTADQHLIAPSAQALVAPQQVVDGQAHLAGPAAAGQHLRLVLGLKTPKAAAEETFLRSLQDKSSPNYHHYLTAAQWNARFSPSAADERSVVAWAQQQGLTVTQRYANRLIVDLDGTVSTIQKAFGVTINSYRLGTTRFLSNDRSVALTSSLAKVVGSVQGMNTLQQLVPSSTAPKSYPAYSAGPTKQVAASGGASGSHAALVRAMAVSKRKLAHARAAAKTGGPQPSLTNGYYDPTDIYSSQAYDVDALNGQHHCCNPTGNANVTPPASSIAISTVGSHNASDYAGFHNQYPYLAYHFQEYNIDGTPSCCDGEGTMDFEWSTAMANSFGAVADTAMVYMYDGANAQTSTFTDIWNRMLSDGLARTMSTSWGCAETGCYDSNTATTDHNIFNSMVGQGWTLIGSSDDKGPYANCSSVSVEYPASDPDVVSAGGTTLQAAGSFSSEVAWTGGSGSGSCAGNNGGGGGGCSVLFGKPSWQGVATQCNNRAEPDVSLNASIGQNIFFNGVLTPSGGTSIVAPELAGIYAQTNAYLRALGNACNGNTVCPTIGDPHYDLYGARTGSPHQPYYDITSGCTSNDIGGGWCAGTGYDLATGLGSANLFQLARAELWYNVPEATDPTVSISGPASGYHNSGTLSWSVTDSGGSSPATGVAGYSYNWDADPGDPASEPHPGSGNPFYSGPIYKNATTGSVSLASAGAGCHTLYVRAWDNIGESGLSSYYACYDGTTPAFTANPDERFAVGAYQNDNPPVQTSWAASDTYSGVAGYYVYRADDSGSFAYQGFQTGTSIKQYLQIGHYYQYEIYALDNAGNVSAPVYTTNFRLRTAQETSASVAFSGGWTEGDVKGASAGQVKYATKAGKTATFTYSGNRVAWVTTLGSDRGKATVKPDGKSSSTVDTNATSTRASYTAFATAYPTSGSHTLTVTTVGTGSHPRVDVDCFLYIQ